MIIFEKFLVIKVENYYGKCVLCLKSLEVMIQSIFHRDYVNIFFVRDRYNTHLYIDLSTCHCTYRDETK